MKTENLSIGLRVLYHAIEWLTVFLILLIFAVQIITPLYAVRVGRADSFLQQLQWLPYRPGVLALGVMLAAVGTILSKCSHEVDSGFLSRRRSSSRTATRSLCLRSWIWWTTRALSGRSAF